MSFQIHALDASQFAGLFDKSDEELHKLHAVRVTIAESPGSPCRVSLADAELGETALLINYEHQSCDSPYRATHAIFVREGAKQATLDVGEVPEAIASRLISVRAFDQQDHIIDADVVDGRQLSDVLPEVFHNPAVDYVHLHNAKQGCFAARVTRR